VSTCTMHFIVRVDKKLWVGFGLFEHCHSFFSTHGAVFGSKCFDYTDRFALPNDATGHSSILVDWGRICIMELGCKLFGM